MINFSRSGMLIVNQILIRSKSAPIQGCYDNTLAEHGHKDWLICGNEFQHPEPKNQTTIGSVPPTDRVSSVTQKIEKIKKWRSIER
jgi:hypothetical protein